MTTIEPYAPLGLTWAGQDTTATPCKFCDDGQTPAHLAVRIHDRMNFPVCPQCATTADPDTARLAARLEALWQDLLARNHNGTLITPAAEILRDMADEIDILNTGDRVTTESSTVTPDGVATTYRTQPRDWSP